VTDLRERSGRTSFARNGLPWASSGLISEVTLAAGSGSATLTLNRNDRYFFDHPLDHVPGMALVTGLLDLVRASGIGDLDQDGLRMGLSLALPTFCELGSMTRLETAAPAAEEPAAGPDGTVSVRACQDGRLVCDGSVSIRRGPPAAGPADAGLGRFQPVGQALVHRQRQDNVLIGNLVTDRQGCTVAVCRPPAGHVLAARAGQAIRPEVLIDAARQFGTLICHQEHDAPLDTQLVLLGVEADIPCGLRRRVYLRWRRTLASRGRRSGITLEVVVGDPDGEPCGRIGFDYFSATPATYRRLRGRKTSA
jgi:A-factor biosynthesis hotdog domain